MIGIHITGWPVCAACGTPVYRITRIESVDRASFEYIAECHGQSERVTLTHESIENAHVISFGLAFRDGGQRSIPRPEGR